MRNKRKSPPRLSPDSPDKLITRVAQTPNESDAIQRAELAVNPIETSVANVTGDTASYASSDTLSAPAPVLHKQSVVDQPLLTPDAMLERTRKLAPLTWQTSTAQFNYAGIPVANELIISLASVTNLTTFKHFTYDGIKVRLTPISNKYFRGCMGFVYWPGQLPADGALPPTRLTSLPISLYDASSTSAIEITLPWNRPIGKDQLWSMGTDYGYLVPIVLAPLVQDTAADITTFLKFNIEAAFVNPRLHDAVPVSTLPSPVPRRPYSLAAGSFAGYQMPRRAPTSVHNEAERKAKEGTISSSLDTVAAISGAFAPLPVVGSFAAGLSVVASAASSVFDWFGLSKPNNLTIPHYANTGPLPYSNTLTGVTNGDTFAANAVPYVSTAPSLVNSYTDELNIDTTRLTPTLIATGKIPAVETASPLLTVAVNPYYGWLNGSAYTPSNLDFGSRPFWYWRGDISYKLLIPASSIATSRIAITHSLDKLTSFSESVRFVYVEIQGTTVVDFTIPWCVIEPYATNNNRFDDTPRPNNGYIQFWSISPVVGDGTAESLPPLTMLLFAAASENFETAGLQPIAESLANTATPQGLLGYTSSQSISNLIADDNVHSFRELLHRPYWINITPTASGPGFAISLKAYLMAHPLYKVLDSRFRYSRYSLTVTLRGPSTGNVIYIVKDGSSSCSALWVPERSPEFTVTLPFVRSTGYFHTGAIFANQEDRSILIRPTVAPAPLTLWMSITLGDDATFGRLLGCAPLT